MGPRADGVTAAVVVAASVAMVACGGGAADREPTTPEPSDSEQTHPEVVSATATREPEQTLRFEVTISSPYDRPDRYADAWRIVAADGTVYGERVLLHHHADEQPFTRALAAVQVPDDVTEVFIEARDLVNGWGDSRFEVEVPAPAERPGTGSTNEAGDEDGALRFEVRGVEPGQLVPAEFTCDGENDVPVVEVAAMPAATRELAVVVDDPDAPTSSPFVHWSVYAIPPSTGEVGDGSESFRYGTNDGGTTMWFGPCPPAGDGPHVYRWRLFALDENLDLEEGLDGRSLEAEIGGSVLEIAEVTATYERAG